MAVLETTQVALVVFKEDLSETHQNLPRFLYRVFKGEPQEGVTEVHVDNVNGCPVAFFLEDIRSNGNGEIIGTINYEDYKVYRELLDNKYN